MSTTKEFLDKAYESPYEVPWNNPELPEELSELISSGRLKPCKALDIGCGAGHHSIALAKKGFDVTGTDLSGNAIAAAQKNAESKGVTVDFRELDALDVSELEDKYDFVLEWGLLHFISPESRQGYVESLSRKINKGGLYLSISFNDQSPEWGGGKKRIGITGSDIFYSSREELERLYDPYFEIVEVRLRATFFQNSKNEHIHNYFLLRRR